MPTEPTLDFDTIDLDTRQASALTRRAVAWLGALLLLVAASAVAMVLFLRSEEAREQDRHRTADAEWLDQTLRFHFRRLEGDLGVLALQARQASGPVSAPPPTGPWWRDAGLVAAHGWLPAGQADLELWPAFLREAAAIEPGNAAALATMLDTTRGLQRAAYAGPLAAADGPAQQLWLAVPLFEQGRFVGDYVAAVPVDRVLAGLIPAWFLQDHRLVLDDASTPQAPTGSGARFLAPINLPGAQLGLWVEALGDQAPLAPRAFFAVALVCLAGMLLTLVALWRDIQRRQRAETRLQTQLALRTAMERSVALGLRAWDQAGHLLYANPAFGRLVGWTPQELIAHNGAPPYWPAGQGDEFEQMRSHAGDTAAPAGTELQLQHRDGHRLDVLVHSAPLALASGEVVGWVGSALDITERRRIERLAARQQELLEASGRLVAMGEVASTLAHELNQPLGALSSFANGLLNRVREQRITFEEIVPVVERMERMAEKAGRVIQRVNAFARRQDMTRLPLALRPFVARVAAGAPLPEGVALDLQLPPGDGPTVPADALLLENALHNLVLNAGEWAPRSGRTPARVRVDLVSGDGQVGVRVADSGPGVPPEQLGTIFDAFASHKPGGMGMGLAICRSIVEAHHGRIEVERSAELHGAQFTLWLPTT
ncbi:two-component system sensor histidine kinase NtrB [Hydrogenophaga taeniospiralis]|uniref:two-component system sensor histidine kinase NtrB n=1 Tax=Hydrogenophaga taeniospiralis TaxID=65656 RepID=UPI001CFBC882|nr:ATP-binding protein [Hydrogenophaga taeniospiralis]UCU93267.1 PAS domain S-box protein [Hydrogenophaga taeniospiralis]